MYCKAGDDLSAAGNMRVLALIKVKQAPSPIPTVHPTPIHTVHPSPISTVHSSITNSPAIALSDVVVAPLVTLYSHLNSLHCFSLTIPNCHPSLILSPSPLSLSQPLVLIIAVAADPTTGAVRGEVHRLIRRPAVGCHLQEQHSWQARGSSLRHGCFLQAPLAGVRAIQSNKPHTGYAGHWLGPSSGHWQIKSKRTEVETRH